MLVVVLGLWYSCVLDFGLLWFVCLLWFCLGFVWGWWFVLLMTTFVLLRYVPELVVLLRFEWVDLLLLLKCKLFCFWVLGWCCFGLSVCLVWMLPADLFICCGIFACWFGLLWFVWVLWLCCLVGFGCLVIWCVLLWWLLVIVCCAAFAACVCLFGFICLVFVGIWYFCLEWALCCCKLVVGDFGWFRILVGLGLVVFGIALFCGYLMLACLFGYLEIWVWVFI